MTVISIHGFEIDPWIGIVNCLAYDRIEIKFGISRKNNDIKDWCIHNSYFSLKAAHCINTTMAYHKELREMTPACPENSRYRVLIDSLSDCFSIPGSWFPLCVADLDQHIRATYLQWHTSTQNTVSSIIIAYLQSTVCLQRFFKNNHLNLDAWSV